MEQKQNFKTAPGSENEKGDLKPHLPYPPAQYSVKTPPRLLVKVLPLSQHLVKNISETKDKDIKQKSVTDVWFIASFRVHPCCGITFRV